LRKKENITTTEREEVNVDKKPEIKKKKKKHIWEEMKGEILVLTGSALLSLFLSSI